MTAAFSADPDLEVPGRGVDDGTWHFHHPELRHTGPRRQGLQRRRETQYRHTGALFGEPGRNVIDRDPHREPLQRPDEDGAVHPGREDLLGHPAPRPPACSRRSSSNDGAPRAAGL
jgi:hypothetical protein